MINLENTEVEERTVAAVLARQVARFPDKLLLRDRFKDITYGQASSLASSISAAIHDLGVRAQEPVLVMMDNHVDFALTWLGISVSPFVEIPINTAYKGTMLDYIVGQSGARVAIVDERYCERLAPLVSAYGIDTVVVRGGDGEALPDNVRRVRFEEVLEHEPREADSPKAWDRTCIMYTSGTTGASKGVIICHGHAFASASTFPAGTSDSDVVMVFGPLFHAGGRWGNLYNALLGGATAVIVDVFSASGFWRDVAKWGGTVTTLIGGMAEFIWQQEPKDDDRANSLRLVGVAPAFLRVAAFRERFALDVETTYGSTEVGSVIVATVDESGPRNSGRPRRDVQARLVDDNDIEVGLGEIGELLIRPSEPWTMLMGYHTMAEETVKVWRNSWFHTGDSMYCDADGQYYFVDRRKDSIRRRGENVSSFEVEAQLLLRPEIALAAVVGVYDGHTEEDIKAVLVLEPGATIAFEELICDLAEKMPYFMVPRYLEVVEAMPLTPTQRVQKSELRAAGVTSATWDREAAGVRVTRHGVTISSQG